METDYIGARSVANLIEITGLKKFIISRVGQHKNAVPIFEYLENGTNEKAVHKFNEWASLTDNNLPYEMVLFNSLEDSELIQEEIRNKKTGKVLRFTFSLNKKESYTPAQANQNAPVQNVSELIENALLKMQMKNNENELLKRLEAMDEKLNGYINDEDEDEDDSDALGGLSLNNPNVINLITLLSQTLGGNKPKASVINGITPDQQKNIEKAVSILSRYDSEIDTDLLKLSALAENQTATFEMLLKTLRNM